MSIKTAANQINSNTSSDLLRYTQLKIMSLTTISSYSQI